MSFWYELGLIGAAVFGWWFRGVPERLKRRAERSPR